MLAVAVTPHIFGIGKGSSIMFRSMMISGVAAMAVMVGGTASAQEAKGAYLGLKMGASLMSAEDMTNTSNGTNLAPTNKKDEDDAVFAVGAAVGYNWKPRFNAPIRTDLEYMYRTELNYSPNPNFVNAGTPSRSDNDLNSHTVMANLYWDIGTWSNLTPFIGGGVGMAINQTDTKGTIIATGVSKDYSNTDVEFAWTVGAGLNYAINKNWSMELSYRYIDLGEAVFGSKTDGEITAKDLSSHEILAGLRYQF
jgi:opacity protein-like surface antigen